MSSEFAVPPQYYHTVGFNVPEGGAHVLGGFRAVKGDNIRVHIMDSTGFENFKAGNPFRAYYSSNKTIAGTADLRLAPGDYFLIFENKYSLLSNKVVRADIDLEY